MKDAYLIFYNLMQFCGWAAVLATGRLDLLMWFQTIQLLEVLHCMVGFVKSSAMQTFLQILSRIIIVWAALVPFPETRETLGYTMIFWAWPIAETTRYIYYAISLMKLNIYICTWCRYTLFIGLYPLGVTGELLILYKLVQLLQRTSVYAFPLPNKFNISFYPDLAIVLLMLSYVPRKYRVDARKKKRNQPKHRLTTKTNDIINSKLSLNFNQSWGVMVKKYADILVSSSL